MAGGTGGGGGIKPVGAIIFDIVFTTLNFLHN